MWKCICIVVQYDEQLLLPLLNNCCYLCGFNVTKCWCALCVVRSFKCNTLTLKVKIYNFKQLKLQQKFWPNLWHGNLMHFDVTTLMWTWIASVHYISGMQRNTSFKPWLVGMTNPWDFCNLNKNEVYFLNCWNPRYILKV